MPSPLSIFHIPDLDFTMSRQTDPENFEEFDEWPDTAQIRHRWLEHGSRGKPRAERPRGERPSKGKSHRTRERDSSEF